MTNSVVAFGLASRLRSVRACQRWMLIHATKVFFSDESGQSQLYVTPFPDTRSAKRVISTESAVAVWWSPDGRELAYVTNGSVTGDDGVYVIDIATWAVVDIITVSGDSNTNVVAVAPEPEGGLIFSDGFETGDTTGWASAAP